MNMLDEIRGRESCAVLTERVVGYRDWYYVGPEDKACLATHDAQDAAMLAVCEAAAAWVHWDDASDVFGERALEMRREAEGKLRDAVAALTKEGKDEHAG